MGDNREASTGVTGTGGLDAGVKGQQVGLEGDLVNQAGKAGDLCRRFSDGVDGGDGITDDDCGVGNVCARLGQGLCGLAGSICRACDLTGDLVGFVDGALKVGGLTLSTGGQILRSNSQLAGACTEALDAVCDSANRGAKRAGGCVEVVLQRALFFGDVVADDGR